LHKKVHQREPKKFFLFFGRFFVHFLFKGVDFTNGFVLKYIKTQISFFSNLQVSRLFQGRFTTKRKFCC